jgi:hypothetical protein
MFGVTLHRNATVAFEWLLVSVAIAAGEAWARIPEGQYFRTGAHFSLVEKDSSCIYTKTGDQGGIDIDCRAACDPAVVL